VNPNEYQQTAHLFCGPNKRPEDHLAMAGLGLAGETTEFLQEFELLQIAQSMALRGGQTAEHIKKTVYHHKPLTPQQMDQYATELSDILWYVAEACTALNISLDDVMKYNIEKLRNRHGGYTHLPPGDVRANPTDISFSDFTAA